MRCQARGQSKYEQAARPDATLSVRIDHADIRVNRVADAGRCRTVPADMRSTLAISTPQSAI
ncbi:hypothetical protein ACFQZ4_02555 [Catellatospora coxensis]|uniref:Uncharacterized protein n=1 Tax=Catellatospora coxensis TaxID=310354 RepID=A0A8J3KVI3_9ACTN|nr:hypothetical protein Cco03nite_60830 [Catellatospora coxensis]